jgi:RNA polymerase sigma-70 factor (TIGR02957 family)
MTCSHTAFDTLRPRLQGIAYRMLGTMAEAEEVVQDAWLRWHEADRPAIENTEAWLVSVTTRIAIDRLRAAKVERENYVGFWLPEPQLGEAPASPEQILERAGELSMAFLTLLERLTPEARAAFLMREVLDADYAELAATLGKSEAACRQLVSRARAQLREPGPRHPVAPQVHWRLMQQFAAAVADGSVASLRSLLADDAQLIGDGGGKVPSFGKVLVGGQRIAQLYFASVRRYGRDLTVRLAVINGEWGLLRFIGGEIESAQSFETDGERIVRIHVQRNPDKLARLAGELGKS